MRIIVIGALISTSQTKSFPAPIGHESISFACSLSSGMDGATRCFTVCQRKSSVKTLE